MLKTEKELDRWFKENGWEETKTKFGMGWKKDTYKPFLKVFLFHSGKILDTENEEDFEERQDDEGRTLYYFASTNKHYYPEWLEPALMKKIDAIMSDEAPDKLW